MLEQVRALSLEADLVSGLHRSNPAEESLIRNFEAQIPQLVSASLAVNKPIVSRIRYTDNTREVWVIAFIE